MQTIRWLDRVTVVIFHDIPQMCFGWYFLFSSWFCDAIRVGICRVVVCEQVLTLPLKFRQCKLILLLLQQCGLLLRLELLRQWGCVRYCVCVVSRNWVLSWRIKCICCSCCGRRVVVPSFGKSWFVRIV